MDRTATAAAQAWATITGWTPPGVALETMGYLLEYMVMAEGWDAFDKGVLGPLRPTNDAHMDTPLWKTHEALLGGGWVFVGVRRAAPDEKGLLAYRRGQELVQVDEHGQGHRYACDPAVTAGHHEPLAYFSGAAGWLYDGNAPTGGEALVRPWWTT